MFSPSRGLCFSLWTDTNKKIQLAKLVLMLRSKTYFNKLRVLDCTEGVASPVQQGFSTLPATSTASGKRDGAGSTTEPSAGSTCGRAVGTWVTDSSQTGGSRKNTADIIEVKGTLPRDYLYSLTCRTKRCYNPTEGCATLNSMTKILNAFSYHAVLVQLPKMLSRATCAAYMTLHLREMHKI